MPKNKYTSKTKKIELLEIDVFEHSDYSNNNDESDNSSSNFVTFIKLKDNSKTEIRYVYHMSDIHIRNTQRHIEYAEVFERTYQRLKKEIGINTSNSLIVLTGDIMHSKTELSPEAIKIAYHFFRNLSQIAPVILIPGNHDCNLSNRNRLDALSPIVDDIGNLDRLYYLKSSGVYQYYNIVFGVTSILNDIFISADKIPSHVWKNIKQNNKYKIALFHGPVHGAKTDVGYRMNNTELVASDFKGYDYVMLGDIHKYQYINDDKTIAYAGSLIQQSYGESLDNHGILKWDLLENAKELLQIKNDYGYCTVQIVNGVVMKTNIPPKPRIRFILENTNQLQYQDAVKKLEKDYHICEIVKESNFMTKLNLNDKKFNKNMSNCITQENIIETYLEKKKLNKDKIKDVIDLHKKIYQKANNKEQIMNFMQNTSGQRWKILELKFSNTLSYGKNNIIYFHHYEPNKVIGIIAPNHYGKSAILDIILFCLFDKLSRGDRKDILNKNENEMYCSLLLSVGNQKYLIERIGQRSKNGLSVKIDVNFYSINDDVQEKLNGVDKNETNKKIIELIGSYDDYLASCICLQKDKNYNFMDMTQLQKKEYLNDILKLNVFENCYYMANEKVKGLMAQLKLLEQKLGAKSLDEIKYNIKSTTLKIESLKQRKNNLDKNLSECIDCILSMIHSSPLIKYEELSEYNLETAEDIDRTEYLIQMKLNQKNDLNLLTIIQELSQTKDKLNELLSNNKIDQMISEKEEMIKKIINIPSHLEKIELEMFIKEKNNVENRMQCIEKVLEKSDIFNIDDQINQINNIRSTISDLRKKIKNVDSINTNDQEVLTQFTQLKKDWNDNLDKMILYIDQLGYCIFNDKQKKELETIIKIKESFIKQIEYNIGQLINYTHYETKPNKIIKDLIEYNQNKLDIYNKWLKNAQYQIIASDSHSYSNDLENSVVASSKITHDISIFYINYITECENQLIYYKINNLEKKLDNLITIVQKHKELRNLEHEWNLLSEKKSMLQNKIDEIIDIKRHMENNAILQTQIKQIQQKINIDKKQIQDLRDKITQLEHVICQHKNYIKEQKRLTKHLKLLDIYRMSFFKWKQNQDIIDKWTNIKVQVTNEIAIIDKEIEKNQIELTIYKKDLEQYLEHRKEFDLKLDRTNIYQIYVQIMNSNGIPYEILKLCLPRIESEVNKVLHCMVNFDIEFIFYDEKLIEEHKNRQMKSHAGCIDINICYQNMKPCSIQLASGFERFIIGLAIRMTLCQISLTAKPNFLIIDEGWSCMDTENRNNINVIIDYIKSQYEHVIIISHLEELHSQADYIINIDKNKDNGYSYIKNAKHFAKLNSKKN